MNPLDFIYVSIVLLLTSTDFYDYQHLVKHSNGKILSMGMIIIL